MRKILIPVAAILLLTVASCGNSKQKALEESLKALAENTKKEIAKPAPENKSSMDADYLADTKGQWAIDAKASSTYATKIGKEASWSPEQMIGVPNVQKYGDNGNAWASKEQDKGEEWVKLTFEKEVNATEVRIKETYNAGAITKIVLYDNTNKSHVVYQAKSETKKNEMQYLVAKFPKTGYKTKMVKIVLDSKAITGWNEIDAVQLVGE
ncbi:MAG: hypothetical protein HXX09_15910 [Bacteroidetes bacterium]|nr:hypothetical protein [Bacteroidota bacterium]